MRKALLANSVDMVMRALEEEPEAAYIPFYDQGMEPPLCFAVRSHCSLEVLDLLLQYGADPMSSDINGRSALAMISSRGAQFKVDEDGWEAILKSFADQASLPLLDAAVPSEARTLLMAGRLLDAGADAEAPDMQGQIPSDVALQNGCYRLARFWKYRNSVMAFVTMARYHRELAASQGGCALNRDALCCLFEMLLPVPVLNKAITIFEVA